MVGKNAAQVRITTGIVSFDKRKRARARERERSNKNWE